jgi:hypothetical protein
MKESINVLDKSLKTLLMSLTEDESRNWSSSINPNPKTSKSSANIKAIKSFKSRLDTSGPVFGDSAEGSLGTDKKEGINLTTQVSTSPDETQPIKRIPNIVRLKQGEPPSGPFHFKDK